MSSLLEVRKSFSHTCTCFNHQANTCDHFISGGASGCLIAGRLAAADPSLKILVSSAWNDNHWRDLEPPRPQVLEAGEHTRELPAHTQPARYFSNLAPTSKVVTFNVGKPSEHLGGRSIIISSGRCVGGGSSVNCMSDLAPA